MEFDSSLSSPSLLNRRQVIARTWAICLSPDVSHPGADTCLCFLTVVLGDLQVFNQCQPDPEVKLGVGQRMCWSRLSCLYQSNLVAVTLVTTDADIITIASGATCSKAAWWKFSAISTVSTLNAFLHEPGPLFVDRLRTIKVRYVKNCMRFWHVPLYWLLTCAVENAVFSERERYIVHVHTPMLICSRYQACYRNVSHLWLRSRWKDTSEGGRAVLVVYRYIDKKPSIHKSVKYGPCYILYMNHVLISCVMEIRLET